MYLTPIYALPAPDQLSPDVGPDVPADIKALADAIDSKLTPYSQGNGSPADLAIAAGKPGRKHHNLLDGHTWLDIGAAWIDETPAANPAANVAGLRTLGVGALDAAAGNDARLSNQRVPTDASVTAVKVGAALKPSGGAAAGTEALRALGTTAGTAAAGNDARLSNARTPTAHAATHRVGGSDPLEVDPDLHGLQHGVVAGGVATRLDATTVRVTAGKGWILQASGFLHPVSWVQTDLNVPVPGVGNRRVDQAVVDSNGAVTRLAGTAEGAGYTLDNRTNAAAVPVGSLRLADVITIQADGGMLSTVNNVRDRRASARGLRRTVVAADIGGAFQKAMGVGFALPDASLQARYECNGKPIRLQLGVGLLGATDKAYINLAPFLDGATLAANEGIHEHYIDSQWDEHAGYVFDYEWTPAAGSHLISVAWQVISTQGSVPTGNMYSRGDFKVQVRVQEQLAPAIDNGIV